MRIPIYLSGVALILSSLFLSGEGKVRLLHHSFHQHYDFVRVSEYFTGKENTGGRYIARTKPEDRSGMYFWIATDIAKESINASDHKLVLKILDSASIDSKDFEFPISTKALKKGKFMVGITGNDWSSNNKSIIAWRIEIFAPKESLIASTQSYLWSHN